PPAPRVEGAQGDVGPARGPPPGDRFLGRALHVLVQGGVDPQAALEQPPGPALPGPAEALVLLELALEAVDEPRVAAADAARLLDLERLPTGLGGGRGR